MKESYENIHQTIASGIVVGIEKMSKGIAESLILGKKFSETLREIAQSVMINLIAKTIEHIALLGIQKLLGIDLNKKEAEKDNLIRKQNTNLKRQIALQAILMAMGGGGGGGFFSFLGFAKGGAVSKGQPIVVGEQGAELFIPNSSGQITQSARGTGGGSGTTVNFNINTVDASGFEDLLFRSRGTISALINQAVNEQGRGSVI